MSRTCSGLLLALAVAAQGLALATLEDIAGRGVWMLLALSSLAALTSYRLWNRGGASPILDLVLVTTGFGGLGMLIGSKLDSQLQLQDQGGAILAPRHTSDHVSHSNQADAPAVSASDSAVLVRPLAHSHEGGLRLAGLWSGMCLGMLLFCVPSCALLCHPRPPRERSRWLQLLVCTFGMLCGMWLGGAFLQPLTQPWLGPSLAAHTSMLAGMAAGTGVTFAILSRRYLNRWTGAAS